VLLVAAAFAIAVRPEPTAREMAPDHLGQRVRGGRLAWRAVIFLVRHELRQLQQDLWFARRRARFHDRDVVFHDRGSHRRGTRRLSRAPHLGQHPRSAQAYGRARRHHGPPGLASRQIERQQKRSLRHEVLELRRLDFLFPGALQHRQVEPDDDSKNSHPALATPGQAFSTFTPHDKLQSSE